MRSGQQPFSMALHDARSDLACGICLIPAGAVKKITPQDKAFRDMRERPYSQKLIGALTALFEQSGTDAGELDRLSYELQFRNTAKARALESRVNDAMANLTRQKGPAKVGATEKRSTSPLAAIVSPHRDAGRALSGTSPTVQAVSSERDDPSGGFLDPGPFPVFERTGRKNDRPRNPQCGSA